MSDTFEYSIRYLPFEVYNEKGELMASGTTGAYSGTRTRRAGTPTTVRLYDEKERFLTEMPAGGKIFSEGESITFTVGISLDLEQLRSRTTHFD